MELWVGTSGFSYKEWVGSFYPPKTRGGEMLRFYAGRLRAVEIDNTFYRMPRASVLESWTEQVPEEFRFTVKASRRITHFKRLKGTEDETGYLIRTAASLGSRLGAILFQLPPNLPKDLERLRSFLDLVKETPAALEFRHASWFEEDVLELLRERGVPLCVVDSEDGPPVPFVSTAAWGYLRLRRPAYSEEDLAAWYERVEAQGWREAFVFFKHEDAGVGPELAKQFLVQARSGRAS